MALLALEEGSLLVQIFSIVAEDTARQSSGLKTTNIEGDVMKGTYVSRGCVPSKAFLLVTSRMCELQNDHH